MAGPSHRLDGDASLHKIFMGEAGSVAGSGDKVSEPAKALFDTMRCIVTFGWSIHLFDGWAK